MRAKHSLASFLLVLGRPFGENSYQLFSPALTRGPGGSGQGTKSQVLILRQKEKTGMGPVFFFWSEWQDSNLRPRGPEETYTDFLRDFYAFSGLFSPKTVLSSALTSTVST